MSVLAVALLATACALHPPLVPVEGTPDDLRQLTGEWDGEYQSPDAGRSGSILFTLEGTKDTATGDVLMIPREMMANRDRLTPGTEMPRPPIALTIHFVAVEGTVVVGTMDPYDSPDCECRLLTTFRGEISGNRIEGTFISYHSDGGPPQKGTWWAERRVKR
jgi:hypothetical protein